MLSGAIPVFRTSFTNLLYAGLLVYMTRALHRFVYVEPLFGSEQEFIEALTKIVRALLK